MSKISWIITIIINLFFGSCSVSKKDIKNEVDELRDQLPQIEMPVEFNSDRKVKYQSILLKENMILKKLIDQYSFSPLGKLFETKNNITILGYLPENGGTPVLITYRNNGTQVNLHKLYETVKITPTGHTSNIVTIFSQRQILFVDSTVIRELVFEIPDNLVLRESVSVIQKKYLITGKGLIEPVK